MRDKRFKPIPEPIGNFIIKSKVAYVQTGNGAYYHYVDVCSLLVRKGRIEQLRAFRIVYWRNVFRLGEFTGVIEKGRKMMDYTEKLIRYNELLRSNVFVLDRIRELQEQLYPKSTPTV